MDTKQKKSNKEDENKSLKINIGGIKIILPIFLDKIDYA